jgi:hypothetical protein
MGVLVRGHFGIAVTVHNLSGHPLENVTLTLEPSGHSFELGTVKDQRHARIFVAPRTESHISMKFTTGSREHREIVVGYVEGGYCGKAKIEVLPGDRMVSRESIDPVFCKRSWLDFL